MIFVKEVFRAEVTYITMPRVVARRSHLSAHNVEKDSFPSLTTKYTSDLTPVTLCNISPKTSVFKNLISRQ